MRVRIAMAPGDGVGGPRRTAPAEVAQQRELLSQAVTGAGGELVDPAEANGLLWLRVGDGASLEAVLDANPNIEWVQLPWAGVESFSSSGVLNRPVTFTCAKGAYGEQVAEHALLLAMASLRHLVIQARVPAWHPTEPESLHGKRVTILGGGGIATDLIALLVPFHCAVRVIRRRAEPVDGAVATLRPSALHSVLPNTDVLVLALALTPETRGIIGPAELALLPHHAILVNVARGAHVDTDALVAALRGGTIAAAGLDVTNPEPLPPGHPLWALDNVLITSHCADSVDFVSRALAGRVQENVARFARGDELIGVVDPRAGY